MLCCYSLVDRGRTNKKKLLSRQPATPTLSTEQTNKRTQTGAKHWKDKPKLLHAAGKLASFSSAPKGLAMDMVAFPGFFFFPPRSFVAGENGRGKNGSDNGKWGLTSKTRRKTRKRFAC